MNAGKLLRLGLCIAALGVPAFADIVIDFSGAGAGSGAITGNATTATGSNILIDTVTGIGTPQNAGSVPVSGGTFNFSATGGSFSGGVYTYTGGTFNIMGTVAAAGASGTLESGTIVSLSINTAGQISLITGGDTKNTALVNYFCGVAPGPCSIGGVNGPGWTVVNGSTHLNVTSGGTGGAFTATTFSTDLPNRFVPEPGSIVMLGTVLVGITQLIRRRAAKV